MTTITPGAEVLASVVTASGLTEVLAVVTRVETCTVFVRLRGLGLPSGYVAGDVFPLNPERVRLLPTETTSRHRDGLVSFGGSL